MKKLKMTLLALTISILVSCSSSATFLASKVYVGMPIADFIAISNGRAKVEKIENGMTIYKATNTINGGQLVTDTKFFYFDSNGVLTKMDGGEQQQTRQQIEIIRK
jgi:hypothetical protein